MANHQRNILLLLVVSVIVCGSVASPVFFPAEVSDEYFTVLPSYFKFSFEAADVANVPAAGGNSASSVQKEDADRDKLGEKALVDETVNEKLKSPAMVVDSAEDSASDEKENSTEPVKKLLIRTFTDLNPAQALELVNKTMSVINETENVTPTAVGKLENEQKATTTEENQETSTLDSTTEKEPEIKLTSSFTSTEGSSTVTASSTDATVTPTSSSSTTPKMESTSTKSSANIVIKTEEVTTTSTTTEKQTPEEELDEIEKEIEAEPVILTQGV